jgi:CheY-like chemotaxis protein
VASKLRVLAIDDNPDDRARLQEALKDQSGLRVDIQPPPSTLDARALASGRPDIAIIDYQLTEREPGREPATFKGSTLAAALREKAPEIPIVLTTRQQMMTGGRIAPARDLLGAFDELVVKETIYRQPDEFVATLVRLARGFRRLRDCRNRNWAALLQTLGADTVEEDELLRADPPTELLEKGWRVSEAARWIRGTVLAYPGILYDSLHAAVALGLSHESFLKPSVQAFFKTAKYRGVFTPPGPYFWKTRLLSRARGELREADQSDAPLTDFAGAWRKRHRSRLELAVCNTSRTTPADYVCYVLREPVKRGFSLPYHPDTRPAVMDEARVSFKAIRSDNRYDERLFPPDARNLLDSIQKGDDLQ